MRLPRFRLTLWRLMLMVPVAAIVMAFEAQAVQKARDLVAGSGASLTFSTVAKAWLHLHIPIVMLLVIPFGLVVHDHIRRKMRSCSLAERRPRCDVRESVSPCGG